MRHNKSFIEKEISLHKKGLSCNEIAKRLSQKKNTVLKNLRNHGVLKPNLGREAEDLVEKYLQKENKKYKRQRGDAPFDFLIGKNKIDVKSANLTYDRTSKIYKYIFQIQSFKSRTSIKDFQNEIDIFWLVFLDKEGIPLYQINTSEIEAKYTISIPENLNGKYQLKFITLLESEVIKVPLTKKGKKIKGAMEKEYGAKKGKQVFYASKNAKKIKGVEGKKKK